MDAAELTPTGELVARGTAEKPPRAPVVDDCVTDDEVGSGPIYECRTGDLSD